jgi:hypothetical protein
MLAGQVDKPLAPGLTEDVRAQETSAMLYGGGARLDMESVLPRGIEAP